MQTEKGRWHAKEVEELGCKKWCETVMIPYAPRPHDCLIGYVKGGECQVIEMGVSEYLKGGVGIL